MRTRHLRTLFLATCLVGAACTPAQDNGGGSTATGGKGTGTGGKGTGGSGGSPSSTGGTGAGTGGTPATSGGTSGSTGGSGGASNGGAGGAVAPAGGSGGTKPDGGGGEAPPSGAFPPGPHKVVLITGDTNNINDPSRLQIIEILKAMKATHNIDMEEIAANAARPAALMDRALIIASPNANYFGVTPDPGFKNLAVPIIVSKDGNTDAFGMGQFVNTAEYTTGLPLKITIINPEHPLAAGLTGVVPVFTSRNRYVRGKGLGPGAIKVATTPEEPNASWALFAYEKGGEMPGGLKAPAKRVGFFWHRPSGATPELKKLFQAAIEWSIRP